MRAVSWLHCLSESSKKYSLSTLFAQILLLRFFWIKTLLHSFGRFWLPPQKWPWGSQPRASVPVAWRDRWLTLSLFWLRLECLLCSCILKSCYCSWAPVGWKRRLSVLPNLLGLWEIVNCLDTITSVVTDMCLGPEGSRALVKQSLVGRVLGQEPLSTSTIARLELAADQGLKPIAVMICFCLVCYLLVTTVGSLKTFSSSNGDGVLWGP